MKNILLSCLLLFALFKAYGQVSWTEVHTVIPSDRAYSFGSTNNGYVFAFADGKLYRSTTGGDSGTFAEVNTIPKLGSGYACVFARDKFVYLVDNSGNKSTGVWRSDDYGITWAEKNKGMISSDKYDLEAIHFLPGRSLALIHDGQNFNKVYISDDTGNSWGGVLNLSSSAYTRSVVYKGLEIYVVCNNTVYMTSNKGFNWTNKQPPLPGIAGKTVMLSGGTFCMHIADSILTSSNGYTWTDIGANGIPKTMPNSSQFIKSPTSDSLFLAVGKWSTKEGSLLLSIDRGATWTPINTGLPSSPMFFGHNYASQIYIAANGYMFVAPDGGGIYRSKAPVAKSTVLPTENITGLGGRSFEFDVYPNPVCDVLNFSFAGKDYGQATATISNMSGEVITTEIIPNGMILGTYSIKTSTLGSGVYILSVSSAVGKTVKKFVKE